VERLLRVVGAPGALRALNLAWLLAIVWSTVAVRQHVVLDVVAGLGWGLLFAALSHRLRA
jgi:membrane-associated phospholipid phosphatase